MKSYTIEKLGTFDGSEGGPAFVAVEGKVYDVTKSQKWLNGMHMKRHTAGNDLSIEIKSAPHGPEMLERLELVGIMAQSGSSVSEQRSQASDEPRTFIMIDATLCIGCGACQAACCLEHELPSETITFKILKLGPIRHSYSLEMSYLPTTCFHCDKPNCVAECPTGAMQKTESGKVFSDSEICVGCQTCSVACPFGAPTLNTATGKIAKCDGCRERVELGMWPSCALKCPTGAITFGSAQSVVRQKQQKEALRSFKMVRTR